MKRTYIAPQSDIEVLNLLGSIMDDNTDPGHEKYSDTSTSPSSNIATFEEDEDLGSALNSKSSLWD